ncbi:MAG: hypothetical protein ACOYI5_06080 [Christensenellales bacterium]|jgi:hypothetical protein
MTAPRFAAGPGFVRDTCHEIERRARIAGVLEGGGFGRLTPAELSLRYEAAREGALERLKLLDTLAWLIGQYVAMAMNAPRKYPAQPNRVRRAAATDEEMRRVMEGIARRGHAAGGEGEADGIGH